MPDSTISRSKSLSRVLLAVLAGLTLWQAMASYRAWSSRFAALGELAAASGIVQRRPGLVDAMRGDAGGTQAALRLARALLADELDQRWILDLPPAERDRERQRGLERLHEAYTLAVESLAERPASWEALLVIGGAEYLRLARSPGERPLLHRELWNEPLMEAHRLAPLQPEPLRFLVAADLGNWSVLSTDERAAAVGRIASAFQDPVTFDLLSAAWLRVAPSLGQALAVVPDSPGAWTSLMKHFARRGDWERYCDARRKAAEAQRRASSSLLDEAEGRLRWGDREAGVQRLLWVGANTRPDAANLELIERVLARVPPGIGGEASNLWLGDWLDWTLERCLQATGCRLPAPSLLRLISLNRDLASAKRAWALAAAGALRDAEAIERSSRQESEEPLAAEWAPYMIAKASLLTARGQAEEALSLLRQVPLAGRDTVSYWRALRDTGAAAGAEPEVAVAGEWLARRARRSWAPPDWQLGQRTARLDLWPAAPAAGVRLRIRLTDASRGALDLVWDGALIDTIAAVDGRVIEINAPVAEDLHTLEIRYREGAPSATAEVELVPSRG